MGRSLCLECSFPHWRCDSLPHTIQVLAPWESSQDDPESSWGSIPNPIISSLLLCFLHLQSIYQLLKYYEPYFLKLPSPVQEWKLSREVRNLCLFCLLMNPKGLAQSWALCNSQKCLLNE